jgi:hypothetical protein
MPSARGGAPVEVPARVIRVRPVSIRGRDLCSAALEFLPHERVRDRLVRMMFDLQLNSHLR